jgi:hypothetical protein
MRNEKKKEQIWATEVQQNDFLKKGRWPRLAPWEERKKRTEKENHSMMSATKRRRRSWKKKKMQR